MLFPGEDIKYIQKKKKDSKLIVSYSITRLQAKAFLVSVSIQYSSSSATFCFAHHLETLKDVFMALGSKNDALGKHILLQSLAVWQNK